MNNRHSANSVGWITPPWILAGAREVLGTIDLDPASSEQANEYVQAQHYITEAQNGLTMTWRFSLHHPKPRSIWLNPPGGKTEANESRVKAFWQRLLRERANNPEYGHAMFLAFSIETTQITQLKCAASLLDFPTCFFKRRVAFIDPETGKPVSGMTHSSCLSYLPGRFDCAKKFVEVFREFGKITSPLMQPIGTAEVNGETIEFPTQKLYDGFGVGNKTASEGPLP